MHDERIYVKGKGIASADMPKRKEGWNHEISIDVEVRGNTKNENIIVFEE